MKGFIKNKRIECKKIGYFESLSILLITSGILFFAVCLPLSAAEPAGVLEIRSIYQETGKKISSGEFPALAIGFEESPSGSTKLYWDPHTFTLVKVVKEQSEDLSTLYTEYLYYPDGNLAFIYERAAITDNDEKEEKRYYMKYGDRAGGLIRFIHTIESKAEIYDSGLALYKTDLIPYKTEAESIAEFFNCNISSLLKNLSQDEKDVYVMLKERSGTKINSKQIVLFIQIDGNQWELILGNKSDQNAESVNKRYYINIDQEPGIITVCCELKDSGSFNVINNVQLFRFPLGAVKSISIIDPQEKTFSSDLPGYIINPSGPVFAENIINKLRPSTIRAEVSFTSQEIFYYDELIYLIEQESVTSPFNPHPHARISHKDGCEYVEILMEVPELAIVQGDGMLQDGFDIFRVNWDGNCESSDQSIQSLEWISAEELLILTNCGGEEKYVIADFKP